MKKAKTKKVVKTNLVCSADIVAVVVFLFSFAERRNESLYP